MIPLAVPNLGQLEADYLLSCVRENAVSTVGSFVGHFEQEVAALSGTAAAAAVASGTQALHLALHVLGIGPGDLVILPSFTFIASANAIAHCGATPWLVDIERDTWTLDPARVADALATQTTRRNGTLVHRQTGRRVSAIMPVYTLGTVARMDDLRKIAREYGLRMIADAAAAIGVTSRGRPIGALADLTAYSFNGNKTITCGGGGAVVGPDPALVHRVKHLSSTARVPPGYDHDDIGFNYRMTNLEAAVGCAQLQRLDMFIDAKRRIRAQYDVALHTIPGIRPFPSVAAGESTCWFSGLVVDDDQLPDVPAMCTQLYQQGIEARPFWKPVHLQQPYRHAPAEDLAVTEDLWSRIVTLPSSTSLTDSEQEQVITALKTILARAVRSGDVS